MSCKYLKIYENLIIKAVLRDYRSDKYRVGNVLTKKVYGCASEAADILGVNYSTFKKWLYLKIPKHNCMWYDCYLETQKKEE